MEKEKKLDRIDYEAKAPGHTFGTVLKYTQEAGNTPETVEKFKAILEYFYSRHDLLFEHFTLTPMARGCVEIKSNLKMSKMQIEVRINILHVILNNGSFEIPLKKLDEGEVERLIMNVWAIVG